MSAWRVVITDSESMTGVAPVCERQSEEEHRQYEPGHAEWQDETGVYDCCPHPHIETAWEDGAKRLAALLTELDAGLCS